MPRYWSDTDAAFIECEVVFSGKEELIDGAGWRMKESPYGCSRPETAGLANLVHPYRNGRHESRRGPLSEFQGAQVAELVKKGLSPRKIGDAIGATRGQVEGWIKRNGIKAFTRAELGYETACQHQCGGMVRKSDYLKGCRSCLECRKEAA